MAELEGSSAALCKACALVDLDRRMRPLDGIRALAVLAVLAPHAGIPFLPGGFVGVDVFFVLSGFLITSLLFDELVVTGRIDLGGFWTRRARRLLPAALVMIVAVVAARPLFVPDSVAGLRGDAIATALWSGNWRWALQGTDYFAQGGTPSPLQHTWSLAAQTGVATAADGAPSEFRHGLLLLTALAAAALVAGVVLDSGQPVARLLSTRLLVGIGRISYGLYLWHWPVYLALDGERSGLHGYVLAALRVAVTGVLAGASFVLIERPAQRLPVRPHRVHRLLGAGLRHRDRRPLSRRRTAVAGQPHLRRVAAALAATAAGRPPR